LTLQPDPSLLKAVGTFFTGPGDPRPILAELDTALHTLGLGPPPAAHSAWRSYLRAREREMAIRNEQDRAALAADVPAFVRSIHASTADFREVAITATVFGAKPRETYRRATNTGTRREAARPPRSSRTIAPAGA
jgi:hypothetical protein